MITSLHVASGAAAGSPLRSRLAALALGPVLHLAGDMVPHRDIDFRAFETLSGLAAFALVMAKCGPDSPATLCAATAAAPDLEHLLQRERGWFPSHRVPGLHRAGGIPAPAQLGLALVLLGLATRRSLRPRSPRATGDRAAS